MSSLKLSFGAALFSMSFLNPQEVQGVLNSLKESHTTHPDTAGDIPRLLPGAPGSLSERLKPQGKGLRLTLRFLCRLSTKGAIWRAARWYDWLKLACGVWVSIRCAVCVCRKERNGKRTGHHYAYPLSGSRHSVGKAGQNYE